MIEKSQRWQRTVVAAAAAALLGIASTSAWAFSLGRISVQSALGEPLRAEIEVPNLSSEEAASLKASVASPAAFTAAGLEYNPAMSSLQATLARKADGRAYLRLTTDKAINDPFIDMIIEASWSSGRIVRDFTMLFDPPALKQAVASSPTLPQTNASVPAVAAKAQPAATPAPESAAPAKNAAPKAAAAAPAPAKRDTSGQQVVVQSGDTASKIAARAKADDVSLDQMLVALLRANPDAFSAGNLNRLRAGAVLDLPSAEQAKSIAAPEATQTVMAQSKDFNEFRRNLAGSAPKAAVDAPDRKASGSVQAKVDDKKAAAAAADKLTLSKGALKAKADEEAKLAKERAQADAKARAAELAKNIEDLKKLSAASGKDASAATAAAAPASAPQTVAPKVEAAPPVAAAPVAAPSAPAPVAAKPKAAGSAPASSMAPEEEASLVDQLMEDPTLPLAGGGLIALLGGFALYRRSKAKKKTSTVDSTYSESSLAPESFFGASGGQQVDTQDAPSGASSMGFNNSQMGSPDDVDPVAEADVYLAYGRDVQAEEILKSALATNPERLAIHSKLLDIYAKRRDTANFQSSANAAFQLTGADNPEWARICELGLTIDPTNPLYQPGGAAPSTFNAIQAPEPPAPEPVAPAAAATTELDLDLDFSAEDPVVPDAPAPAPSAPEPAPEPELSNGLDFDISGPGELDAPAAPSPQPAASMSELSLDLDGLSLDSPAPEPVAAAPSLELPELAVPQPAAAAPAKEEPASNEGMLEFDLGSLSLDLDSSSAAPSASSADSSLETKLALAEEFVSIGDTDGARALIEEVVAEATGDLRERAQRALANLN